MFIQVIQGRTSDAQALRERLDSWDRELQPGAKGYLGSTGGVTDDGQVILLVRFESQESARANGDRPEQGTWWEETSKLFDGEVTFHDCPQVETKLDGGSDDAGFVQVMQGRVREKDSLRALEDEFMPKLRELRPDLIGSVRAWDGDFFTQAVYFTSEAEARQGESRMASEVGDEYGRYSELIDGVTYLDLKDPWLRSP